MTRFWNTLKAKYFISLSEKENQIKGPKQDSQIQIWSPMSDGEEP
jgi:hypothetical protein